MGSHPIWLVPSKKKGLGCRCAQSEETAIYNSECQHLNFEVTSLQNCEKTITTFCHSSHLVCGAFCGSFSRWIQWEKERSPPVLFSIPEWHESLVKGSWHRGFVIHMRLKLRSIKPRSWRDLWRSNPCSVHECSPHLLSQNVIWALLLILFN